MPTLLTCVVGKRLSESPEDDHWSLRDESSQLLAFICLKYGDAYPNLQPRILKTLMKALITPSLSSTLAEDPVKKVVLPPKYGAIVCLKELGTQSVEMFLLPNVKKLAQLFTPPKVIGVHGSVYESPREFEKCQIATLVIFILFNCFFNRSLFRTLLVAY